VPVDQNDERRPTALESALPGRRRCLSNPRRNGWRHQRRWRLTGCFTSFVPKREG